MVSMVSATQVYGIVSLFHEVPRQALSMCGQTVELQQPVLVLLARVPCQRKKVLPQEPNRGWGWVPWFTNFGVFLVLIALNHMKKSDTKLDRDQQQVAAAKIICQ
eukprot:1379514-Amphidinium_carterae.1